MKNLVKIGLIGVGLALVFKDQIQALLRGEPAPAPAEELPAAPAEEPPGLPEVAARMAERAGRFDGLNLDQWNYFYEQETGSPGPAPENVGIVRVDPMPPMTIADWVALVSAARTLADLHTGRVS